MKGTVSFTLLCLFLLMSFTNEEERGCNKGNYHYSPASYKDELFMKEKYQLLFDSLLEAPVYDCFCRKSIQNLPTKSKGKKPRTPKIVYDVSIEPFFVNLQNNDGLYGKRIWRRQGPSVRFQCGYLHHLFVIADQTYYALSDDSLSNVKLVKEKLSKSFTLKEIEGMIQWNIKDNSFCNDYTFDWPYLIKSDTTVLWDIKNEIKMKSE